MHTLAIALALACAPQALVDFALARWRADPAVRIEDAYKWIYQVTRGGEHAIPDEKMARDWLEQEWATIGEPRADEPLWQPLCPDGAIGRLNLRPFRARGGKIQDLLAAFVVSSRNFRNDESNFRGAWNEFGRHLKRHPRGKLIWRDWKALDRKMRAAGYPAIHHSKTYDEARRPAYRVITGEEARKLIAGLKP
jgi:hypothetical protein